MAIKANAQINYAETPAHFNLYQNNPYNNLAFGGIQGTEASLLARQNLGNFGNVSTQYFSSFFGLEEKNNSHNVLGLLIYNDKEGDYLRTNRFYGSFIRHQEISDTWKVSLGISGGLYLFRVKFNTVTGGVSQTAIDGSASLGVSNSKTKIGITLNQFLNNDLGSSLSDLKLSPFIVITGEQQIPLNEQTKIALGGYYKPISINSRDLFNLGFSSEIICQKLGAGLIYDLNNGFSITGKLANISIVNQHQVDVQFAYFSPFANNLRQRIEVLEFSLHYFFKKNNE